MRGPSAGQAAGQDPRPDAAHATLPPSPWVQRFAALLAPGATVLDLACGSGRHLRWLAAQGYAVTGVDRDAAALAPLSALAETVVADLEAAPWPLPGRRFGGIVVTNYLWRPLWPALRAALAEGGVLICETFAAGHERIGRPARPEFLLRRGELLHLCDGLRVVAYEDGWEPTPARQVQRIAAVQPAPGADAAARYPLTGGPAAGAR
ncbi:MAG: methyltransferase domain-containing protein [Burkholderiales bacterium]|nr:methyltransferase domain-containing protein [Burkholderiales bacterium]